MLSPRRKAALICLAIFFVLAALAIYASPVSSTALQARLQTHAEDALYRIRADEWAEVRLEGQVAYLTGRAPSVDAREAAVAALSRADWAGGVVAGGVARVVDETSLANAEEAFSLRAERAGARLTLSGFAPDADAAARISAQAERLFGGQVESDMRIFPGGAPLGWESAVRLLLQELARLDAGVGLIENERVALVGLAANAQTEDAVRAAFETTAGEFRTAALIRRDGGAYEGAVDDEVLCTMLVRAALAGRPVSFSPGLDALTAPARAALRRAGEAFAACSAEPLQVRVREDAGGSDLAQMRATAIVAAMAQAGVDPARFVTSVTPADAARAVSFEVAAFEPVTGEPAGPAGGDAGPDSGTEAQGGAIPPDADDQTEG
jgi:hypothetical protein